MATSLLPTHTFVVRASSDTRRKTSTSAAAASGGGKWWSPLFGWSADADYIDSSTKEEETANPVKSENTPAKSKFSRGCFTEEKAKQLRMMTKDTASFHDVMYHSAIASRLASDFSAHNSDHHQWRYNYLFLISPAHHFRPHFSLLFFLDFTFFFFRNLFLMFL